MASNYDVVIVGGGHNGLTSGIFLRKQGRRVLVVERADKIGGMASSGYMIPEAPQHLVHPCAGELLTIRGTGLIEELNLAKYGLRQAEYDPPYAYLHPDGRSIALFLDHQRTADDISRFSKADGQSYLKFMELMTALREIGYPMVMNDPARPRLKDLLKVVGALIRNRKLKSELQILVAGTADQIACEYFEHPATVAYLTGLAAGAGPIDVDGGGAAYMLFAMLHRWGTGKPIGGMQKFSDALAACYHDHGGELRLNAVVEEIIIQDGKIRGVRLQNGETITAEVVLATCDPHTAFRLATPGGIERRLVERMKHVPSAKEVAPFVANIATSGPIVLKKHQSMRHDDADLNKAVCLIGSADDVRDTFKAARRGEISATPAISVTPTSNCDPTQAPPGQAVAYVYLPGIVTDPRGGWTEELKRQTTDNVLRIVSEYYDGFDREIGRFVETPRDREKRVHVTNGCVTHVDFASTRMRLNRPAPGLGGPAPIVPGLFIGGNGIHPGGGISGMAGKTAANRVHRYLKK